MRLLALDQSTTATGWSTFVNGKLTKSGVWAPKGDLIVRINRMKKALREKVVSFKPDLVAAEDVYKGNTTTFKKLCMVLGVALDTLYEKSVTVALYGASTWRALEKLNTTKKVAIANGFKKNRDYQKHLAIELVKKKYKKTLTDDEAESILIGEFAIAVNNGWKK